MRFYLFLFPYLVICQSVIVESNLDTNYAKIGDILTWTIVTNKGHNKKIHFPELKIDNEKLSIISNSFIIYDKKIAGIKFEISFWDTGNYATPDYSIDILKDNGNVDYSIGIDPNILYIASALSDSDNIDFRPLSGPIPVKPILPIKVVIISILLIKVIYFLFFIWKKRINKDYVKANYLYLESPKERAIKRMENLNGITVPKDFYSEISRISKKFIEEKFYIYVLEMTTEEIEINRSLFPLDDVFFSKWLSILHRSDLVKYASNSISSETMIKDKDRLNNLIKCI